MLNMRFPSFDVQAYKDKIFSAAEDQLNRYSARLFTAKTPEEVFADDDNQKK
jgi:IS30 family transposase